MLTFNFATAACNDAGSIGLIESHIVERSAGRKVPPSACQDRGVDGGVECCRGKNLAHPTKHGDVQAVQLSRQVHAPDRNVFHTGHHDAAILVGTGSIRRSSASSSWVHGLLVRLPV